MTDPSSVGGGGTASQPGNAGKKPRSPVERTIVWGGIIVLLGVVAVEARARKGYEWTLNALQKQLEKDEGASAEPLLVKDIDNYVVGWPRRTESEEGSYRKITLTWGGLFRSHGIDLTYDSREHGEGLAVLGLATHGAEETPPPVIPEGGSEPGPAAPPGGYNYGTSSAPAAHNAESSASPAGGAGPGGGGLGGGRRFDPMQQDTDGDGKISKDEAQGRFKDNFDQNDTNGDGFVDAEEIAAMRARFQNRQGGGGPGGAGRGRPDAESGSTPAEDGGTTDKPAESTPSESTPAKEGTEAPAEAEKTPGESAS